ncbi:MAG: glycosyltransferase family 1 protein [Acidobacteria bacterium]|nr:glycosyltransferase family 1 protein [Acidobacteriota bacterium]
MSRILITTFGSFGDVNPYIGLGIELQRRGHTPVLAMPAIFREAVEREGLRLHAIRPDLDVDDAGLIRRIMDPARGTDALFGEILIPSLAQSHADLCDAARDADLLVTHPAMLAGPIVAEQLGLPWASSVLAPLSMFSVFDPMVPPAAPWLYTSLKRWPSLSRAFLWLARRVTDRWARPVRTFRASLGLPVGGNPLMEAQHSPSLVLAMFSNVLATPQPDWPRNVRVTGAVLYNGPAAPAISAELDAFLSAGPPPVMFTLGTSAVEAAGDFFRVSADAALRLGVRAVMLVGRHARNRPDVRDRSILAVDYAPHAALFPRASVVVHQCGAGTLHQALAAGRPMLAVPFAHDQPDNARRLVDLGVARVLTPRRYMVDRLTHELRALLTGDYARRAEAVGATVRDESGAVTAADAIDALLADRNAATPQSRRLTT